MQRKTMVSRGMAVLGSGGQCTREAHLRDNTVIRDGLESGIWEKSTPSKKSDRAGSQRYHVDFNTDVPPETAELWVGTPYAAWIEKDVIRRHQKENMAKLMELQQQIDEEARKRRAVEQQLLEAREELKQIPPLQEALMQCKQTMLKYVEKGVAASSLGNIRTVCRDILTEWRRHAQAKVTDRLRRRVPDVGRCHFELTQLHEEGLAHLKALQIDMLNTVTRFMDKDAMIIPPEDEDPWELPISPWHQPAAR
ncbi:unnamed protein product [Effrenium voratum]|uniref:Uncharacterized protein n=1 Tax=Effrenium voratum TaxID=2562239 RepID=A0AA36MYQ4_9DINO|nr:unnamed protein product [Effrenium voratum]CAJ1412683.1 unnamed protein product [Effrenium voratum]